MKHIIVSTNRPGSKTRELAEVVRGIYDSQNDPVELIDLAQMPWTELKSPYEKKQPSWLAEAIAKLDQSDGIILVVPEYNGSYPGILKYFIDHWTYPRTFEARPICFIGLGGRWGGLRPIEHLQQVFGYRNGYGFPERVFVTQVDEKLKDGKVQDAMVLGLLQTQAKNFKTFVDALLNCGLHANKRKK